MTTNSSHRMRNLAPHPQYSVQYAPHIQLARATATEASFTRRGDTRRLSVVPSCSLLSHHIPDCIYHLPLETLDLSVRLFNLLRHAGVTTVGQILEMDLEALSAAKLGEKSIVELTDRIQALHLLDPVEQGLQEEQPEVAPAGRHDNRRRPGRGKLRAVTPYHPTPSEELHIAGSAQFGFCYKVRVAQLPDALRMILPRWARCGVEQDEENKTDRSELPRRTQFCYIQAFTLQEPDELTEWRPGPTGDAPNFYRAAATPDTLRSAAVIEVDPQEAQALLGEFMNAAVPSPAVRVAPAFFLSREMREMIAPGVAFPDACLVPQNAPRKRASLDQGNQVPVPRRVAGMRIEQLSLSSKTLAALKLAGVTTVGALLALEEERLGAMLDREGMWELYTAVFAKSILPTPDGLLPAEYAHSSEPAPISEVFYFYPTGLTYDDQEQGRLYLVQAALFVDRLDGSRSGPVETIWLTRAQIGQSLLWHRDLTKLDSIELRTQVTLHAIARGAALPHLSGAEDQREARRRQMLAMEEQYNLVPLSSEDRADVPLELFVSVEDMKAADQQHLSPTSTVIEVLEHYLEHPQAQPAGHRLSVETLDDMHYWLIEDRKEWGRLNRSWRQRFPGHPCPAGSSMIMDEQYTIHSYKEWNEETGRVEEKQSAELIGYRLIIGVLARTRVPSGLIVEPRRGKPVFSAPIRPITPIRTPNFVPIARVA